MLRFGGTVAPLVAGDDPCGRGRNRPEGERAFGGRPARADITSALPNAALEPLLTLQQNRHSTEWW